MFINKVNNENTSPKMYSAVNIFLNTQITCFPRLLTKLFGSYYNNALCNAAFWIFTIWCLLHGLFDKLMDVFLKKLRYREYVRLRLSSSLWYLGFYGSSFIYCYKIVNQNNIEFFTLKKIHRPFDNDDMPNNLFSSVILGYLMLSMFYLHSCVWEGLVKRNLFSSISYALLFVFMFVSYTSGVTELFGLSLKLIILISTTQLLIEFTRCWFMSSVQESFISKLIGVFLYFVSFGTYVALYLFVIPLICLVRLGLSVMTENPDFLLIFLFFNLLSWLGADTYQSILFRFINHWLYHRQWASKRRLNCSIENIDKITNDIACDNTLFECSLFLPRDDQAYHIKLMIREIKERKAKMMASRKSKATFFQTLKCVVDLKRKISQRQLKKSNALDECNQSENVSKNKDDLLSDDFYDYDVDQQAEMQLRDIDEGIEKSTETIKEINNLDEPVIIGTINSIFDNFIEEKVESCSSYVEQKGTDGNDEDNGKEEMDADVKICKVSCASSVIETKDEDCNELSEVKPKDSAMESIENVVEAKNVLLVDLNEEDNVKDCKDGKEKIDNEQFVTLNSDDEKTNREYKVLLESNNAESGIDDSKENNEETKALLSSKEKLNN